MVPSERKRDMARYNTKGARTATPSAIKSEATPSGLTHEGGPGYARDTKSELFLLAVTNFVGQDTFYEKGQLRDDRYVNLVRQVAVADPVWMQQFVVWLRQRANMRTAAMIAGLEGAKALLDFQDDPAAPTHYPMLLDHWYQHNGSRDYDIGPARALVSASLFRADEPGEAMAYWLSRYGRAMPKPIKRGIADAAIGAYTQYSALKYDTGSKAIRFADVIQFVHAKSGDKSELFKYLLDSRYGNGELPEDTHLALIGYNQRVRKHVVDEPTVLLNPSVLREAGMTWEDALSLAGDRVPKKELWEALAPTMGYMALLRNLRNMDQAGVGDDVARQVAARLANPVEVERSRQLPLRFLSAYRAAPSLRWSYPLEQAINLSLANVPALPGRTLILIDTSASMNDRLSGRSELLRWDAAVSFGLALAIRAENATVVSFSDRSHVFTLAKGESLLAAIARWKNGGYHLNGGTSTAAAVRQHYAGHDRVIILTDEQAGSYWGGDPGQQVPAHVPLHTINLAGYRHGHAPSGTTNRYTYGGLTDAMFGMIPTVEAGVAGKWPWED